MIRHMKLLIQAMKNTNVICMKKQNKPVAKKKFVRD